MRFIPLVAAAMLWSAPAQANPQVLAIAAAFGAAGEAAGKVTDGFGKLVREGVKAYDEIQARQTHKRLMTLHVTLLDLRLAQNTAVVKSLEDYARNPAPSRWPAVVERLSATLMEIEDILQTVRAERSDFVAEDAYADLHASLRGRVSILTELRTMSPPTRADQAALRQAVAKYREMMASLKAADDALAAYLRQF